MAGGHRTSATPSDSITTATANAVIVGVVNLTSGTAPKITPGARYTQIHEDRGTISAYNCEFRIATTATSSSVDWTSDNQGWSAYTASFKVSGAGGATTRTRSLLGVGQ